MRTLFFQTQLVANSMRRKIEQTLRNYFNNAGVPDYQLYQLRKTAFTNMAQQTDVRTLQAFSGHNSGFNSYGKLCFPN